MGKTLFNGFCILCYFSIRKQTYWFRHGKVLRYKEWFSEKAFNLSAHKFFILIWFRAQTRFKFKRTTLAYSTVKQRFRSNYLNLIYTCKYAYIKAFIYICERAIKCVRVYLCIYILRVYVIFFGWAIPFLMYISKSL